MRNHLHILAEQDCLEGCKVCKGDKYSAVPEGSILCIHRV